MKQPKQLLAAGLLLSLNVVTAHAALQSRAGGAMVYDTDLDITWLADANLFKTQADNDPNLVSNIISDVNIVADSYYGYHTLNTSDFDASDGRMTWWGAQAWAANLSYGGVSDWRLPAPATPSSAEYAHNKTGNELGYLFYSGLGGTLLSPITTHHNADYSLFSNVQAYAYWLDSEYALYPLDAWHFVTTVGVQATGDKGRAHMYAWAVRSGDIAAVPVPAAVWLFGSALLGLAGIRRRGQIG